MRRKKMSAVKAIVIVILAILCMIVVLQNTEQVESKLLFTTVTMPRAVLLFGTTLVGFVLGVLAGHSSSRERR